MDNRDAHELFRKFQDGKCTPDEERCLAQWVLHLNEQNQSELSASSLEKMSKEVWKEIDPEKYTYSIRFKSLRAVAAVLFFGLASGCIYYYFQSHSSAKKGQSLISTTIEPGGNKAVLTLTDGSKIMLQHIAKGKVAIEDGIQINKTNNGELVYEPPSLGKQERRPLAGHFNTITTPKGGQYSVVLPDGTKVWLNASSKLTYPTLFSLTERKVKLSGEAYFEVAKLLTVNGSGERLPFIVETDREEVEVLGTQFNVHAYSEEETVATTLVEGLIKICPVGITTAKILKPGQQSVLSKKSWEVREVDTEQFVAWKKGDFYFDGMPLREVMKQLERWYDVEVIYKGDIGNIEFGGSISRSKEIREVLDVLELTGLRFQIKERRVLVMP